MKIVNGKLIDYNQNRVEEIAQDLTQTIQRCQSLESQIATISKQDYGGYFQQFDRRISRLEKIAVKQNQELLFLKLGIVLCLLMLGFISISKGKYTPEGEQYRSQQSQLKPSSPSPKYRQ